jgi:hypothetical protein
MDLQLDNQTINSEIKILPETISNVLTMVKWTKFISIFGMIGIGLNLLLLFSNLFNTEMSIVYMTNMALFFGTILYKLVINVVYFILLKYLFSASNKLKLAFINQDSELLTEGLLLFKKHIKILGIFTLIVLSVLAVVLAVAFLGAMTMM